MKPIQRELVAVMDWWDLDPEANTYAVPTANFASTETSMALATSDYGGSLRAA